MFRRHKPIICLISLPNSLVHEISLDENAIGQECLDKMCSLLGIVENDYFGLWYNTKSGLSLWINNRLKIKEQMKSKSPYYFQFKVKYFVEPNMLQQSTTRHMFYLQVKEQLYEGQIPVRGPAAVRMGALISQAEYGDRKKDNKDSKDSSCFPSQCFREWTQGIARNITKEHATMTGMTKTEAEKKLLEEAAQQEYYGVNFTRLLCRVEGLPFAETCFLGIGGKHIRLCDKNWKLTKRIPYPHLSEASFHSSVFIISYRSVDANNEPIDKAMSLLCPSHRVARYLFRALTEDHTFFTHDTVTQKVRNHLRHRPWRHFSYKYLHFHRSPLYYFDVERTAHESYAHAWETLHQVNQNELTASVSNSIRQEWQVNNNAAEEERESENDDGHEEMVSVADNETVKELDNQNPITPESSSTDLFDFSNCGLSKSSCDIAKELLEEATPVDLPPLQGKKGKGENKESRQQQLQQLNKDRLDKIKRLLQTIKDSKVCRVCMDRPISAVFCPCGHNISCYTCALSCRVCPLCRSSIAYTQYVYSS